MTQSIFSETALHTKTFVYIALSISHINARDVCFKCLSQQCFVSQRNESGCSHSFGFLSVEK